MMDRVRGAVFSSLGDFVAEARVLDLFSGSGALGIEALSRGAASCVFVDRHRKAVKVIRANLAHAHLTGTVRLQDAALAIAAAKPASFDLIFADPPFALEPDESAHPLSLLTNKPMSQCVRMDGLFVVELPIEPPLGNAAWKLLRRKRYGQAWVAFYRREEDG
jgi:16S rRNA (guanine966-N2)-methyltransferase|tara:strand:+ start:1238 stop:1726 length:489 start_codon:yes stop_codon:yes gene_type:complete